MKAGYENPWFNSHLQRGPDDETMLASFIARIINKFEITNEFLPPFKPSNLGP
jgi:hypothetical protein